MNLPDVTQQPVMHVDGTPDEGYPLRILGAYRANCDCLWTDNTAGDKPLDPLCRTMNELQRKRAEVLDRAIAKLRGE